MGCGCVRRCPDYLPVAPAKTSPWAGLSEITAVASTVDARSKVSAPEVVICPEGVTVTGKAEVLFTTWRARQGPGSRPHGTDPRKIQGPGAQAWMQHLPPAHAPVTSARTRKKPVTLGARGDTTRGSAEMADFLPHTVYTEF